MTTLQLKEVRAEADALGISYHHRAGAATIQTLIDAHVPELVSERVDDINKMPIFPTHLQNVVPMTATEYNKGQVGQRRKECGRLIRCRIQNMNPIKSDWNGEILSVGSAKLGTYKKFIPFGSGEAYHVPKIIFDMMMDKKCSYFYNARDERGNTVRKSRLIPEYAIEVLDDLTPDALSDLAKQQALAAGQEVVR